ncbi:MAG TPA: hypothetical protein V6C57_03835 [Coleofasciculaceae cyanobacterium]
MNTPQPSADAARIIDVLKARDGTLTRVMLKDGCEFEVHNIAWGQDMGDPEYHVTTNISPRPAVPHAIDFFSTGDVTRISDPQSGDVYFEHSPPNTSLERTRDR